MTAVLTINIESIGLETALQELSGRIDDLTPVMQTIGEIVAAQALDAFESETSPAGAPWIPSIRALKTGDKTLSNTGLLSDIIVSASASQVEIGTLASYGAIHQFGGRAGRKHAAIIPSRPFLPDQDSLDWVEVKATLQDYLRGIL